MAIRDMTGVGKLAAVSAIVLTVSIGLCGLTAAASSAMKDGSGLVVLGVFESVGIVVGIFGLLIAAIWAIVQAIANAIRRDGPPGPPRFGP